MHIFVTLMLSGAGSAIATSAACTAFKNQLQTANPDYTSVTTTFYPANAPVNIANNVYSIRANTLPAFCRVPRTFPSESGSKAEQDRSRCSIHYTHLAEDECQSRDVAP